MKIAHIGDVHWGLGYPGPAPDSRFNDISRVMDWAAARIIEEQCELVLFAGDAFKDARVFLDRASLEIKAFADWLRTISAAGIEVIIISGTPSHDAIAAYRLINEMQIPRVTVCLEPEVMHYEEISIACLPGMNRSSMVTQEQYRNLPPHVIHQMMTEKITETCKEMLEQCNSPAVLLAHLSYDMADKGFEDVLMQHEPVLTQEAIQGYDLVCLGHIHRPQQRGNVFYCGSPERLSFNDEDVLSGFYIHKWDEKRFDSLFIDTPARRFYTIKWDESDVLKYLQDPSKMVKDYEAGITRIRYTCSGEINKQINRKALEHWLYGDCCAFFVAEIKGDVESINRVRDKEVNESLTADKALIFWCNNQGVAEHEVPTLVDMTRQLMAEAVV